MAYALTTTVNLDGFKPEDTERMLAEQVIPGVKQLPGFQRGVWMRSLDDATGMGVVVFDTEENANAALEALGTVRPAEAPPITTTAIHYVTGLA